MTRMKSAPAPQPRFANKYVSTDLSMGFGTTSNDENKCRPGTGTWTGTCVPRRAHVSASRHQSPSPRGHSEPVPRSTRAVFRATASVSERMQRNQHCVERVFRGVPSWPGGPPNQMKTQIPGPTESVVWIACSGELPWPGGPPNLMKTKISVPPAQNRARQQADAFGAGTVMASSGERPQSFGGSATKERKHSKALRKPRARQQAVWRHVIELLNVSTKETAMLTLPPIPTWQAIHPLIVHFPIVLLLIAPLFIAIGVAGKPDRSYPFLLVALILMALGTMSTFLAASSGDAAGHLLRNAPQVKGVLEKHEELAETTEVVFSALTLIFASILFVPRLLKLEPARAIGRA